jgi:hypothetical protein
MAWFFLDEGASVEISPIIGIRAMPVLRARPVDPGISTVFDIENPAIADETYAPSGREQPSAAEDEEEAEELAEEVDSEDVNAGSSPREPRPASGISFFA